ncbi:MAG: hypothetical protein ACI9QD_001271, partial [Thermoproteota archaeon]
PKPQNPKTPEMINIIDIVILIKHVYLCVMIKNIFSIRLFIGFNFSP